ncbi:TfuA-like protein [Legionella pneumophila]|nr:TfuA-like protein [Legionella pneumophila]
MGALRAAELDAFGMKGYGRIYEMYKNEEIDGDDEVAIAYSKYNNEQTIPLINIRLTLERINITNKETILDSIQSIFYAERTWGRIAQQVSEELYHLIKSNYADVKRGCKILIVLFKSPANPSNDFSLW